MKKIFVTIMTLLIFSAPLYAKEFEDDEDEALYEAKERVEEARQRVEDILERRERETRGKNALEVSFYNDFVGNTGFQQAMDLYKAALLQYQMELEAAKIRKEQQNIKRKRK